MPQPPAWFEPLTSPERVELARLFAKATGLPLTLPPEGGETPAAWIATFDCDCRRHCHAMEVATSNLSDANRQKFVYDPRAKR